MYIKRIISVSLLLMLPVLVIAEEIKPFTTDGCSAFPNGTLEQQSLWAHCCIRHDLAYWKGGTEKEREAADKALSMCVAKVGEPEITKLMLAGVRVGGTPYLPTSYRWGYGWPYLREYRTHTENEKKQIQERLKQFEIMIKVFQMNLVLRIDDICLINFQRVK